jgi:23S rRNA (guanosine2251-2'-O)-methyltransferase
MEAVKSGKEIDRILISKRTDSQIMNELFPLIRQQEVPFQYVPEEKLNRVTRKNHQGVIAFISQISYTPVDAMLFKSFDDGKDPVIIILDQISDVRNFGAIARSAECMGAAGIVIPEKGSARINADAVKTSAGALMKMPVARVASLRETLNYLRNSGLKIIAISEKGEQMLYNSNLSGPLAIIMGAEDTGISPSLLKLSDEMLSIPMTGETESLNVSAAATVVLYEILRQRMIQ